MCNALDLRNIPKLITLWILNERHSDANVRSVAYCSSGTYWIAAANGDAHHGGDGPDLLCYLQQCKYTAEET